MLHLGNDKAVGALVEHGLPEIRGLAGAIHVGSNRFGAHAPVGGTVHLVNQVHLVDLGALLALGVDSAEALEAAATSGHLLHADDAGAFLGALKRRHETGDAGTNHHKIAILGGGQLVGGNLAILKAHRPARTGAGRLPYGHPGGVARKAVGVLAGFGGLLGGNGHASAAEGGHGARSNANGASAAQEIAPRYASFLHGSSFSP